MSEMYHSEESAQKGVNAFAEPARVPVALHYVSHLFSMKLPVYDENIC